MSRKSFEPAHPTDTDYGPLASIGLTHAGPDSVATCWGDLDAISVPALQLALECTVRRPRRFVVDLGGVRSLDGSAAQALHAAVAALCAAGTGVQVRVASGSAVDLMLRLLGPLDGVEWADEPRVPRSLSCPPLARPHLTLAGCVFLATPAASAAARGFVRDVLRELRVPQSLAQEIHQAAGEALMNAAEHDAHPGLKGRLLVICRFRPERLCIEVHDEGPAFCPSFDLPPPDAVRGRGLAFMRLLTDRVEVSRTALGNVVRLHKALPEASPPSGGCRVDRPWDQEAPARAVRARTRTRVPAGFA